MLLFWLGQVLSYVFVFGPEPFYDVYVDQPERLLGLSPLADQRLAGVVMMVEQALTLGLAFVLLFRIARRERPAVTRRVPSPSRDALAVVVLVRAALPRPRASWRSSLYVRAWRRGSRRLPGAHARFGAGLLLVVGALNSPLGTIAIEYLVLFHLLQNVMISDWAPPLLLIGLTPAMRAAVATRGGRRVRHPHAPGGRAAGLARRLVRRPPRRRLRRGRPEHSCCSPSSTAS